jgi:hypothetical protein
VAEKGASGDVFDEESDYAPEGEFDYLLRDDATGQYDGFDAFDEKNWINVSDPGRGPWHRSGQAQFHHDTDHHTGRDSDQPAAATTTAPATTATARAVDDGEGAGCGCAPGPRQAVEVTRDRCDTDTDHQRAAERRSAPPWSAAVPVMKQQHVPPRRDRGRTATGGDSHG